MNLNTAMVRSGYAFAFQRYTKRYWSDEQYAHSRNLGIWNGPFTLPW